MNMKSIRKSFWTPKRENLPIHEQLELQLPATKLTRSDIEAINQLRKFRESLR